MAFLGSTLNSRTVYCPSRQLAQCIVAGWTLASKGVYQAERLPFIAQGTSAAPDEIHRRLHPGVHPLPASQLDLQSGAKSDDQKKPIQSGEINTGALCAYGTGYL
jgi:hypothetical protein